MVVEQLKALITAFCQLTKYLKRQWAERFDSWPPSKFRVHLMGLVEPGGFVEIQ